MDKLRTVTITITEPDDEGDWKVVVDRTEADGTERQEYVTYSNDLGTIMTDAREVVRALGMEDYYG